jgi:hypothetical protein
LLTWRQLDRRVSARREAQWGYVAWLAAAVVNCQREEGQEPVSPDDLNPLRIAEQANSDDLGEARSADDVRALHDALSAARGE